MALFTFGKTAALELIDAVLERQSPMLFVKDQGVYAMVGGEQAEDNVVKYARGFDPTANDNWYEKAYDTLGGDDFGFEVASAQGDADFLSLLKTEQANWKTFRIHVNANSVKLSAR